VVVKGKELKLSTIQPDNYKLALKQMAKEARVLHPTVLVDPNRAPGDQSFNMECLFTTAQIEAGRLTPGTSVILKPQTKLFETRGFSKDEARRRRGESFKFGARLQLRWEGKRRWHVLPAEPGTATGKQALAKLPMDC
jgi:hypothetical protein